MPKYYNPDDAYKEAERRIAEAARANAAYLVLSYYGLTALPPEIGNLKKLKRLYLDSNKLTTLPPEIGNLQKLSMLYLGDNNLTALPPEIGNLKNLISLYLGGNDDLTVPPPEIVDQGIPAIREYLNALKEEAPASKVYEAKLIVVGQGGVGKTCICDRLINDNYNEQNSTEGIEINEWEVKAPDGSDIDIKMNVWDFGGQEIYHSTHQFFLTKRSVYLLVWDARHEDKLGLLDHWLYIIETFGGDSPIILVSNKCDERTHDINLKDIKERFPQVQGFCQVSCKHPGKAPDSFDDLKDKISEAAWGLSLMGHKWFDSWLTIRKILEVDKRTRITHKEYLTICKEHDVKKEHTGIISEYLHHLGVILHFKDDGILKHLMILKPEWGTDAVYNVLDVDAIKKRKGVLIESDQGNIWKAKDGYPHDTHPALLRLMSNFELAFQMGSTKKYLVAELLPKKPPAFDWDDKNNLQFQYHYSFMPAGIMPRFIVRIHEDIQRDGKAGKGEYLCWKDGTLLSRDTAKAYVRAIPGERRIEIRVTGTAAKKRELLAAIRHEFDVINKRFNKIKITKKIPCQCTKGCKELFDYEKLLLMEEKCIEHEFCQEEGEQVSISTLLDGVETKKQRQQNVTNIYHVKGNLIHNENRGTVINVKKMNFQQVYNDNAAALPLKKLESELELLREALLLKAGKTGDVALFETMLSVKNAEDAAKDKKGGKMMEWLSKAGKASLTIAKDIGVEIATAALKKSMGLD